MNLKESGQWQGDHRQTGEGGRVTVCVCVCEWGVVDVFTMGNEPISGLPRG